MLVQSTDVTIRCIEVLEEDDAYALAESLQTLIRIATHADTTAVALKQRIVNQLRMEGLDGTVGGMRGFFGESSDAVRTAEKVIQPLRAINADLENAARNAHVFRNRTQALVFDPIRAAREARRHGGSGLVVR